jgi:phospholipase/lecithinase/hemolysin
MKKSASNTRRLSRVTQSAIASAAFALLVACGGGSSSSTSSTPAGGVQLQVVSFGDSLSDVGTYAPVIQASFGGGRFTTNPGEVWTQKVAEYYGGTLSAAYLGGFGQPLVATSGLGYAQGGSDVVNPQGEGWAPSYMAATTVPVVTQVANYLSAHTSFNANQLVLINGGANDIFQAAAAIQAAIATNPTTAPTVESQEIATLEQAAAALAQQVVGVILQKGATHVVVSNVPDISLTPEGLGTGQAGQALFSLLTTTYNSALSSALAQLPNASNIIQIDAFTWQDNLLNNTAAADGFTVTNTGTACNLASMEANATAYATANPNATNGLTAAEYGAQFGSSLFCSPQNYTVAGADQTYMYADLVHPTTHVHALFAAYVETQIAASGLGK